MEFFERNPKEHLSTHRMGGLGLKYWLKGRREWALFNQATLERKARDLRDFGLLVSYTSGKYVYFKLPENVAVKPKPETRAVVVDVNGVKMVRLVAVT